jgi:hypothetical protein
MPSAESANFTGRGLADNNPAKVNRRGKIENSSQAISEGWPYDGVRGPINLIPEKMAGRKPKRNATTADRPRAFTRWSLMQVQVEANRQGRR